MTRQQKRGDDVCPKIFDFQATSQLLHFTATVTAILLVTTRKQESLKFPEREMSLGEGQREKSLL